MMSWREKRLIWSGVNHDLGNIWITEVTEFLRGFELEILESFS